VRPLVLTWTDHMSHIEELFGMDSLSENEVVERLSVHPDTIAL